jgi:hypothetical protein
VYTADEWLQAQANVRFLIAHARRGRGAAELAMLLFANGFVVSRVVVIESLNAVSAAVQRSMNEVAAKARAFAEVVPAGMRLDAVFESSSAMSRMMLAQRAELARLVRRNLRKAGLPHSDADVETVLVACVSAALGVPVDTDDEVALNGLMYGFGAHGLLESVVEGVGPVVDDGLAGIADALGRASRAAQTPLASDVTMTELINARGMVRDLAAVFRAVPEPVLHFLGGSAVADIWDPLDPVRVTQTVTWAVNARRDDGIDPSPIFDAARDAGWWPSDVGGGIGVEPGL